MGFSDKVGVVAPIWRYRREIIAFKGAVLEDEGGDFGEERIRKVSRGNFLEDFFREILTEPFLEQKVLNLQ